MTDHPIGHTLYRKPLNFDVEDFFENLESSCYGGGWIFYGEKGRGKATFAYRLARFLLQKCHSFQDPRLASLNNPTVEQMMAKTHRSFMTFENDQKAISMEDVRGLLHQLSHTRSEDSWRIVLIDSMDSMNRNVSNALLKILETPPEKTIFILIVHNIYRILPTLRSRCRKLFFPPLSDASLVQATENFLIHTSEEEKKFIFSHAKGSLGKALCYIRHEVYSFTLDLQQFIETKNVNLLKTHLLRCQLKNLEFYFIFCEIFLNILQKTLLLAPDPTHKNPLLRYRLIHFIEDFYSKLKEVQRINLNPQDMLLTYLFIYSEL